ncbi:hypothetical protein AHF37_07229 [Paragonimus kellicotti]|nr:hypothetical protein AHF37_07229 [Paragonimus kellicotti]
MWSALLFSFPHLSAFSGIGLKVAYTFWMCQMFFCMSGVFVLTPTASNLLFGDEYWAINFGMIYSAFIIGSIISAVMSSIPMSSAVMLYNFSISGAFCALVHELIHLNGQVTNADEKTGL